MKVSLATKLIVSFFGVVALTGFVATFVGLRLIGRGIIQQAQDKVRLDLYSAHEVYYENLRRTETTLEFTVVRPSLQDALEREDKEELKAILTEVKEKGELDILTVLDRDLRVVCRANNPAVFGDSQANDNLIQWVVREKKVVSSTEIVPHEELVREGGNLAERATIKILPTPKAKPSRKEVETLGMMLKAAAPIFDQSGEFIGILCGGNLINQNYAIVDKIKDIVYHGEKYRNKDIGTATIFQGDLRISTNVPTASGERAIGTRVSSEVYDQVLTKGSWWIDRAFVVNNWYITAYEPIGNLNGEIIGILYVGMLEDKFVDMKNRTLLILLGITLIGVMVAMIVSYLLATRIVKPIKYLVYGSQQLAKGDLTYRVKLKSKDEIGELGETFNYMASSLKERDDRIKQFAQREIMKSQRLASLGQLAAGVAHEINNPLGAILIYSNLLLEDIHEKGPLRHNLKRIVHETNRCTEIVKGLLQFARKTEPRMEPSDVNELLNDVFSVVEKQAQFQNIAVSKNLSPELPTVMADKGQIRQVFMNIILNAAEALNGKGDIILATRLASTDHFIEIEFTDNGPGIPSEDLDRVFEPFFTTKDMGTGLGLSISYGIIERHKGSIFVKSEPSKGTTFVIRLPAKGEETKK